MALASLRKTVLGLANLAGPISFTSASFASLLFAGVSASAVAQQDYIDVEAERRAAALPAPLQTQQTQAPKGGAVSYGVGNAPSAVSSSASSTLSLPPPAAPAADNIGGLFNQVQQLQQEVMRLNGLVEQQAYELRLIKEQSLERYMEIDRRLASGASGAPSTSGRPPASGGAAISGINNGIGSTAPDSQEAAERPGEGEAYRAAYALVRGQEFDNALAAFKGFLQRFPEGRYAPNAHYWLGELYLVVNPPDPEAARQSFMLLLNQYPGNSKIPDALYKLGRVQFIKGNNDGSRDFLNRVIREYPESSAASLARDFIDQNL